MTNSTGRLTAALAFVAIMSAGCLNRAVPWQPPPAPKALSVNGVVVPAAERTVRPHIAGPTLTGAHLDTRSWAGHVIVINVWGSWCAPCRKEAPELARAARVTAPEGVKFLGIDVKDTKASAIAFERTFGITYPSIFDAIGATSQALGPVATAAVPMTYVLDTQGRVAARFVGRTSFQPLVDTIEWVRTGSVPDHAASPSPT